MANLNPTTTPAISARSNTQTIDQSWFNTPKTVIDTLWTAVYNLQVEASAFLFQSSGPLDHLTFPATDVYEIPVTQNITLSSATILVTTPGSAGTLEVGFEYKRGAAAWQNVMTTNPTRTAAAGAGSSTNGVVNPLYNTLLAGDILRLNIPQIQTGVRYWSASLGYVRS